MRSVGIVRRVDHLGRIVLPKELRELMNLRPNDGVEIFIDDNSIVLKKYNPSCVFCGAAEQLVDFRGKIICESCLAGMRQYI